MSKYEYTGDSPVDIPDLNLQVKKGDIVDDQNNILAGRVDFKLVKTSKKGDEN